MRIMGLDASTSTIGLAIIEASELKLIHYEYYKPSKKEDIFHKLQEVRKFISTKINEFKPDLVALEDIILFMKGHSTAKTISGLAVLNRTVGLAVLDYLGQAPYLMNVMSIRSLIKIDKKAPKKEEVPDVVAKHLNIDFPYLLNKKGKILNENYDMADAMAAAIALHKKISAPIKVKRKKK